MNLHFLTRKERRRRESRDALRAAHPLNGNCPVLERGGDGTPVGRCYHALRGTFCPRHGNLAGHLERIGDTDWGPIDELSLPPREEREMAPEGLFKSSP